MARIERATSPLPRECSTTEPHGRRWDSPQSEKSSGRGLFQALVGLERETGIEPASSAWKAGVLPLNYSRSGSLRAAAFALICLAVSWWRRLDSNQRRRKPTDLQSAPFSHSGTPPRRTCDYSTSPLGNADLPPVDEVGSRREVVALGHERAIEVVRRMTRRQRRRATALGTRRCPEIARLRPSQQEYGGKDRGRKDTR